VILSLDASTAKASVALVSERGVEREEFIDSPRGRGGVLSSTLQGLLGDGVELVRVVVGTGPGSYNGIRSAIAVAWGISAARAIPLVGISSLLGLAEATYCAVGDARREQYYFACVRDGSFLAEPELLDAAEVIEALKRFPRAPVFASAPIAFLGGLTVKTPSAARLARLAAEWTPGFPQPIYLKAPHITAPRQKGGSRKK
jgi:tRNA threonylcarbamoyladenosine biosynthesis protein TsaB